VSINRVTGSFYRKGKCEVCGKTAERTKSFSAPTHEAMMAMGARWTGRLRHKKCEWLPVPDRGATS
jgi:hypothetical protein